jgi:hypothetical protein
MYLNTSNVANTLSHWTEGRMKVLPCSGAARPVCLRFEDENYRHPSLRFRRVLQPIWRLLEMMQYKYADEHRQRPH